MFDKKKFLKGKVKEAEKNDTPMHEKGESNMEKMAEGDMPMNKYKNLNK